ncbi:hypothetical protein ACJJIW_19620 [Microbulbifer sp. JMSA004]|uniref:hypothetical protein n=1 Tax=Microbulbifer sp. JMSA004 TaxID=3243370 RepID=UPI0040399357
MMDPLGISSYTIKHEGFLERANSSLKPEQVVIENYAAVYIGGGYGTLFDVASNRELQRSSCGLQGPPFGACRAIHTPRCDFLKGLDIPAKPRLDCEPLCMPEVSRSYSEAP